MNADRAGVFTYKMEVSPNVVGYLNLPLKVFTDLIVFIYLFLGYYILYTTCFVVYRF